MEVNRPWIEERWRAGPINLPDGHHFRVILYGDDHIL